MGKREKKEAKNRFLRLWFSLWLWLECELWMYIIYLLQTFYLLIFKFLLCEPTTIYGIFVFFLLSFSLSLPLAVLLLRFYTLYVLNGEQCMSERYEIQIQMCIHLTLLLFFATWHSNWIECEQREHFQSNISTNGIDRENTILSWKIIHIG